VIEPGSGAAWIDCAETLGRRITGQATVNDGNQPLAEILGSARLMNAGLLSSIHGESPRTALGKGLTSRCGQIVL